MEIDRVPGVRTEVLGKTTAGRISPGYVFRPALYQMCHQEGGPGMTKQDVRFIVVKKDGVVTQIGRTYIFHPKPRFGGGGINWYDDSQLIRKDVGRS